MQPSKPHVNSQKAQRRKAILKQETSATSIGNSATGSAESMGSNQSSTLADSDNSFDRDLYKKQAIPWDKYSFIAAALTGLVAIVWYFASQYFAVLNLQDDAKNLKSKSEIYDKFQIVTESRMNQMDRSIGALENKKSK
jgi:hypothetical protein